MAEITMPKLSDTMTEGVVVRWHKKKGDVVATGDVLAEIETDKATMEIPVSVTILVPDLVALAVGEVDRIGSHLLKGGNHAERQDLLGPLEERG